MSQGSISNVAARVSAAAAAMAEQQQKFLADLIAIRSYTGEEGPGRGAHAARATRHRLRRCVDGHRRQRAGAHRQRPHRDSLRRPPGHQRGRRRTRVAPSTPAADDRERRHVGPGRLRLQGWRGRHRLRCSHSQGAPTQRRLHAAGDGRHAGRGCRRLCAALVGGAGRRAPGRGAPGRGHRPHLAARPAGTLRGEGAHHGQGSPCQHAAPGRQRHPQDDARHRRVGGHECRPAHASDLWQRHPGRLADRRSAHAQLGAQLVRDYGGPADDARRDAWQACWQSIRAVVEPLDATATIPDQPVRTHTGIRLDGPELLSGLAAGRSQSAAGRRPGHGQGVVGRAVCPWTSGASARTAPTRQARRASRPWGSAPRRSAMSTPPTTRSISAN